MKVRCQDWVVRVGIRLASLSPLIGFKPCLGSLQEHHEVVIDLVIEDSLVLLSPRPHRYQQYVIHWLS